MKLSILLPASTAAVIGLLAFVVSPSRPLIKEMRQLRGNDSLTGKGVTKFFYNPDGRVARVENSNGVKSVYEYKTDVIYRRTADSRSGKEFTDTFLLNDKGMVRLHKLANDAPLRAKNIREYDPDGLLVKEYSVMGGVENVVSYTNKDGNPISSIQRFAGKEGTKGIYHYTTGINTIGNDNMGMGFEGHNTKSLLQSHIQVWQPGDTNRTSYRYIFDAQDRVSVRVTYYDGRLGDSTAYTYY